MTPYIEAKVPNQPEHLWQVQAGDSRFLPMGGGSCGVDVGGGLALILCPGGVDPQSKEAWVEENTDEASAFCPEADPKTVESRLRAGMNNGIFASKDVTGSDEYLTDFCKPLTKSELEAWLGLPNYVDSSDMAQVMDSDNKSESREDAQSLWEQLSHSPNLDVKCGGGIVALIAIALFAARKNLGLGVRL